MLNRVAEKTAVIEVVAGDRIVCFDDHVLEMYTGDDSDSARLHVGLIASMTIEDAGAQILLRIKLVGPESPMWSFEAKYRTNIEELVSTVQSAIGTWRSSH